MTNTEYYEWAEVEFETVTNPDIDRGPFVKTDKYGIFTIDILTPEEARAEIAKAGVAGKEVYRDGGSFEIITKEASYEFLIGREHTKEGFCKYKPWITKTHFEPTK